MEYNPEEVEQKMAELIRPVDQQLMMCDDRQELLMFACVMLQRVTEILDNQIGRDGRNKILQDNMNF
jgi:hypothetical protein